MNKKASKIIRKIAKNRTEYQAFKREYKKLDPKAKARFKYLILNDMVKEL